MVLDTPHYGFRLNLPGISQSQRQTMIHLAVNQSSDTFALAMPIITWGRQSSVQTYQSLVNGRTNVVTFNINQEEPLWSTILPRLVTAMLPAVDLNAFIVLDTAAEIRFLCPKISVEITSISESAIDASLAVTSHAGTDTAIPAENMNVKDAKDLGELDEDKSTEKGSIFLPELFNDENTPIVRQQQLTEIFDIGPAFTLPPVEDLFEQVVGLFGRKPVSPQTSLKA